MIQLFQSRHAAEIQSVRNGDMNRKCCGQSGTCRRTDLITLMSQAYKAHTLLLQQVEFPSEADGYQICQEINYPTLMQTICSLQHARQYTTGP